MVGCKGRGSEIHSASIAIVLASTLVAIVSVAEAVDHVVGGTRQWDFAPQTDKSYYQKWADNSTFNVGDVLVFNYAAGSHDVAQYDTKAKFDRCNGTTVNIWTTGSDRITLTSAGTFYYVCSFLTHCSTAAGGMKLAVTTASAVGSPPAPSNAPISPTPPPPSGASLSSSLPMAGLVAAAFIVGCVILV